MGIDKMLQNESVEKSKLEWGPNLGNISWDDAQIKISKLNSKLAVGERKWRLPTEEELVTEFNKTDSTQTVFEAGVYWSGTEEPVGNLNFRAHTVHMEDGESGGGVGYDTKDTPFLVRCVR